MPTKNHTMNQQQKKVYICGKVTGLPYHEVTRKFGEAHLKLLQQGYLPVNPLAVVNDWHMPWEQAMRLCIKALMDCDAVYLLHDWQQSKGAKVEHQICMQVGIAVFNPENQ